MIHNYKSCWPTPGPYWSLRGAPKGPFGLKQALTGRKALGARLGARFGPNCCRLVRLGWSHGYHTLWPGIGPFLGPQGHQKGPFWPKMPLFGPKRAHMGPEFQIVANLSCDLSKVAREGHSANEKNFVPIRFTSSEKIPKNYKCILAISAKLPNW